MSFLGTSLALWVGPTVPVPLSPTVLEALDSVEVSTSDSGRSGFQLTFKVGRSGTDVLDYGAMIGPQLRPFNRVLMVVTFGGVPQVLMDGVITHQQLSPGEMPGSSTLTVTGEDVSVMMDLEEKSVEHPAQPEAIIALKLIASYAQYGLIPRVIPPPSIDVPLPTERIPSQQCTDLEYLQKMAERFAYVFYIIPGPAPGTNTAYWGPPTRVGMLQRALSVNLGSRSNVTSINFQNDSMAPTRVEGSVQDRRLNEEIPIQTPVSTRIPLGREPAWLTQSHTRVRRLREAGLDAIQAYARGQAQFDSSNDRVVVATGELDVARYEGLLQPRGLVGLRGAGDTYDGFYYVQQVSHTLAAGSYKQSFTLTRDGTGSLSPVVVP